MLHCSIKSKKSIGLASNASRKSTRFCKNDFFVNPYKVVDDFFDLNIKEDENNTLNVSFKLSLESKDVDNNFIMSSFLIKSRSKITFHNILVNQEINTAMTQIHCSSSISKKSNRHCESDIMCKYYF